MSEQIDDGGPAYPTLSTCTPGMSLLDWFAGQYMTEGMQYAIGSMNDFERKSFDDLAAAASESCYQYAAAMVAEKRRREVGAT